MGQILSGKKRALQYFEVCYTKVEPRSELTIAKVLKAVEENAQILKYLPDQPLQHVTKDYLFTIVNTLDPTFFRRAEDDNEQRLMAKAVTRQKDVVEIDPGMYELI